MTSKAAAANAKAFIVMYNDGQYTRNSTRVIGVVEKKEEALLTGWERVLEDAMRPYIITFYKEQEDPDVCGLGSYSIEEWDIDTNKRIMTYRLGELKQQCHIKNMFDAHLKKHHEDCEDLLHQWHDAVVKAKELPLELQQYTYISQ